MFVHPNCLGALKFRDILRQVLFDFSALNSEILRSRISSAFFVFLLKGLDRRCSPHASMLSALCWVLSLMVFACLCFCFCHHHPPSSLYPLVICYIAIENDHLYWIFPLKMVTFHSYVSLPEGRTSLLSVYPLSSFLSWSPPKFGGVLCGLTRTFPGMSHPDIKSWAVLSSITFQFQTTQQKYHVSINMEFWVSCLKSSIFIHFPVWNLSFDLFRAFFRRTLVAVGTNDGYVKLVDVTSSGVWVYPCVVNCYPLVICYMAIEDGPFIVDLPIENGDFP